MHENVTALNLFPKTKRSESEVLKIHVQACCNIQIHKHGIYAFPRGQMLLVRGFTPVSDPPKTVQ